MQPVQPPTAGERLSKADEKALARALSPDVAWPTLLLAAGLPILFATFVWLGLSGRLPAWACTPFISYVAFAHYSLVHEAVHGNIVARDRRYFWVNTFVGWIGAIGLGIGWPLLQRTHVLHHAHTNTDQDPDIEVKGTFARLIGKWLTSIPTSLIPVTLIRFVSKSGYASLEGLFSKAEIFQSALVTWATLALLGISLVTGHLLDWLFLLFIPQQVAVLLLMVFFQWLPHYPFDQTVRYHNTRISLWPGGELILLQQNLHLVHHLWPSVPFYRYRRLYRALEPSLIAEGCRIEGFGVGPFARDKSGR
jgi:beta-carotene hydroxylase